MTMAGLTRSTSWALLVFAVAIGSRSAFGPLGPFLGTIVWKAFWIGLCFLAVTLGQRMRLREVLEELGLKGSLGTGLALGLTVSLPMFALLAATLGLNPGLAPAPLLATAVVAPVAEEVLFRGYLFLQLYRRAGWSFATAILTTAVLFGLAHVGPRLAAGGTSSLLGEVGMIAAGGAFYAWLLVRWRYNLWVAIAAHAFMNLSCELCACDVHPGAWPINLGRVLAALVAVAVTLAYRRRQAELVSPTDGVGPNHR